MQPPATDGMLEWMVSRFGQIWQPLLLGSVLLGAMASLLSNIAVRLVWRWYVSMQWKRRMRMKRLPPPPQTDSVPK
jgi:uncharacterized protein (DUF2062 family)